MFFPFSPTGCEGQRLFFFLHLKAFRTPRGEECCFCPLGSYVGLRPPAAPSRTVRLSSTVRTPLPQANVRTRCRWSETCQPGALTRLALGPAAPRATQRPSCSRPNRPRLRQKILARWELPRVGSERRGDHLYRPETEAPPVRASEHERQRNRARTLPFDETPRFALGVLDETTRLALGVLDETTRLVLGVLDETTRLALGVLEF